MPQFTIAVDGKPGDASDLYQVLTSTRLPLGVALEPVSERDGTLSTADTIIAAVSTLAALGSLTLQICQWKAVAKVVVHLECPDGTRVILENPEPETIRHIWELSQRQR
ncbi:hypothetical protein [Glycomyces buryatensis]|uniref:Uncharacterized protein n=1 Tax=Glycomyces buryatensis TaxID=2570927 RepID=A0A4V4HSQ4_9ACTN|nr:hypothetical protein [Glycomyces buryatensis]THV41916.1 hypothetical protein FAB82_09370 [Glycomyces buryatensis]